MNYGKVSKRKPVLYRSVCVVDCAITDLSSIMKRFVQTGEVPCSSKFQDVYQYGNDDDSIDAQRVAMGESQISVNNSPSDSFANLSDEEMDLIPDAPSMYLNIDEHGDYVSESIRANAEAKKFYRAKERELKGKSLMSQQKKTSEAVKIAESLGYKKDSES